MQALLRKLTVDSWRAIDEEYLDPSRPRAEAAAVLLTVTLGLIVGHFWGSRGFIVQVDGVGAWFRTLPEPRLWPHVYWGAFKLVSYFLLPVLCIKLVLKERVVDFGLAATGRRKYWGLYLLMLLFMLPVAYGASFSGSFLRTYPKYHEVGATLWGFFTWEFFYGLQFFLLEFFFRGFMIFALARHFGALAIVVMVVPYAMIHFAKPWAECVGSIFAGIILGTIALRTRSIYGGVLVHCGVAWAMDLFAMQQKGILARLFG